jgi:hypothetical protein
MSKDTMSANDIKKFMEAQQDPDVTRNLEARRLLSHLDHAGIPDSVCEETPPKIQELLYSDNKWGMCEIDPQNIIEFLHGQNKKWANEGFRIVIEGGNSEWQRRRVVHYCLYRAIIARFDELHHPVRMFDWPSILPILINYTHPDRTRFVDIMHKIDVLALTEIDLAVPRTKGDLDTILTSVLRCRMLGGKPTVITLKRPSWLCTLSVAGSEINELVNTRYNTDEDRVIRLRIKETSEGSAK